MSNLNVNIDAAAVISQNEQETYVPKKKTEFNVKNYLQARLGSDETTKKITIRLLPFSPEGGSPFKKVHMHTVKVNKEVTSSGWKTFVCPEKNDLDDKHKCPFCETSEEAKRLRFASNSEIEKKKYGDIEFLNRVKESWIVRCIERGHEEDGVKCWLFTHSRKKDGVYDKIMNLFKTRWEEGKEEGIENNIFDLNTGKDLVITLTKDSNNKTSVQVTDKSISTPLSTDFDKAESWVNDEKKWTDVFTVKPYDYMAVIVEGGTPVYDKELGKYVDKSVMQEKQKIEDEKELAENLTEENSDFTNWVEKNTITAGTQSDTDNNAEDALPF